MRLNAENNFYSAIKGIGGQFIAVDRVPDCLRVFVSEIETLGESLVQGIVKRYSIFPEKKQLIELDMLIKVLALFKYSVSQADRNDLRGYIFN